VKSLTFFACNSRGLLQPAVKCRGRDYLRIIYGSQSHDAEHLTRLPERGLSD
jgi:protein phosphatase